MSPTKHPITSRYKLNKYICKSVDLRHFGVRDSLWGASICTQILIKYNGQIVYLIRSVNGDVTNPLRRQKSCPIPSVGSRFLWHPAFVSYGWVYGTHVSYESTKSDDITTPKRSTKNHGIFMRSIVYKNGPYLWQNLLHQYFPEKW